MKGAGTIDNESFFIKFQIFYVKLIHLKRGIIIISDDDDGNENEIFKVENIDLNKKK